VASCWIFYVNYTMMHGSTNNMDFGFHKAKHFIGQLSDILARRSCVMNSVALF